MARLLHGRPPAERVHEATRRRVASLGAVGVTPRLALVSAGGDSAASTYAERLVRGARALGMGVERDALPREATEDEVVEAVERHGRDGSVHGILLLTPLPQGIDALRVADRIPAAKDIEGLGATSAGLLAEGRPHFVPSTAEAVIELLRFYEVPVAGVDAVVVGRSAVVGRPVAALLVAGDATVTLVHRGTKAPERHTRQADLVVLAMGRAGWLKADMVREGATVIDAGINVSPAGMVGDADEGVAAVAGALSPVPGGVGALTTALLLRNVVRAAEEQTGTPAS